jgi:hypothetical protein
LDSDIAATLAEVAPLICQSTTELCRRALGEDEALLRADFVVEVVQEVETEQAIHPSRTL